MVFSLVYVSSATLAFSQEQLRELLGQSRRNNAAQDISGMLLYNGGNFMQLLEGDEQRVRALFAKIARDPRHSGSLTLLTSVDAQRAFPNWSMAFRDMNDPSVRALPGFNTLLSSGDRDRTPFNDPTRAQKLLLFFKDAMR